MVSFCEKPCFDFNANFAQTNQLPGAAEALRTNPVRYSPEAFAEDDIAYLETATGLLGRLHSNAYLRENCEVNHANKNHPLTLQKYTGIHLE